eukprot:1194220-Prorocentrum_minimum.AAC.2
MQGRPGETTVRLVRRENIPALPASDWSVGETSRGNDAPTRTRGRHGYVPPGVMSMSSPNSDSPKWARRAAIKADIWGVECILAVIGTGGPVT